MDSILVEKEKRWYTLHKMRIAFVGKGGSGKTTLSKLLSTYLAEKNLTVVAIDADINQHLGTALGFSQKELYGLPQLGEEIQKLKLYVRGKNKRLKTEEIIKTTPPGRGSQFITLEENNPLITYFERKRNGVRFMAVGELAEEEIGVKCYHSKTGAVELLLNHLIDRENEYLVVDMTAGADAFSSGLFTKFDSTIVVVEPTLKSIGVYQQYKKFTEHYHIQLFAVGNKIETQDDVTFIESHIGEPLIASFLLLPAIKRSEREGSVHIEEEHREPLEKIYRRSTQYKRDWLTYYEQTLEFHKKNALSWANTSFRSDLRRQIDPDFDIIAAVSSYLLLLKGGEEYVLSIDKKNH